MIRSYEVLAALPAVCCAVGMSACGGDSPTATEDDAPPSVSISEPSLDGDQVFTSTVVTFSATATDEEDGDISDEIEWLSSLAGEDPESTLRRQELSGLVHVTLDHLPSRYADVLEWKYIQDLSVSEIAARLGLGYKAAESVLSRARSAFREAFSLAATEWVSVDHRHARGES